MSMIVDAFELSHNPTPTIVKTRNPTLKDYGEQTENPTPTVFEYQTESPVAKYTFHPTGDAFLRKSFNPTPSWRLTEAPTEEYPRTENPTLASMLVIPEPTSSPSSEDVPFKSLNPTLISMLVTSEPTSLPSSEDVPVKSLNPTLISMLVTPEPTSSPSSEDVPVKSFNPTLISMLVTPEPTSSPSSEDLPVKSLNPTLISMLVTPEPTSSPSMLSTIEPTEEAPSVPVWTRNPTLISMLVTPEPTSSPSSEIVPVKSLNPTLISMWKTPSPTDSPTLSDLATVPPTLSPTEEATNEPTLSPTLSPTEETVFPTPSILVHKTSLPTHNPISSFFSVSQVFDGITYSAYLTEMSTFKYVVEESVAETVGGLTYSDVYITSVTAYSPSDTASRKLKKTKRPKKIFTFASSSNFTDDDYSTSSLLVSYQVDPTSMERFGATPYYDDTYGDMAATLIKAVEDGSFTATLVSVAVEVGATSLETVSSSVVSVVFPTSSSEPTLEPTEQNSRAPTIGLTTTNPTLQPTYFPTSFPTYLSTNTPTKSPVNMSMTTTDVFAATGVFAVVVFLVLLFPYLQLGFSNMARLFWSRGDKQIALGEQTV